MAERLRNPGRITPQVVTQAIKDIGLVIAAGLVVAGVLAFAKFSR